LPFEALPSPVGLRLRARREEEAKAERTSLRDHFGWHAANDYRFIALRLSVTDLFLLRVSVSPVFYGD